MGAEELVVDASPLKIIQLITRMDTIGGAQIHVRDISIHLKLQGHDVCIVSGGNSNRFQEIPEQEIPVHHARHLLREVNVYSDLKAFFEIRRLMSKIQPDIVAIHSSKAGLIGRFAAWSLRIPVVFTAHGWSFTEGVSSLKRSIYRRIEKLAARISDGIITVSEYDKQLALSNGIVPTKKMVRIHNGVHDIDAELGAKQTEGPPSLVMVARFAPPKRQLKLIQILYQLQQHEWTMHFVGDGPELNEVKNYVETVGLNSRIHFVGACEKVDANLSTQQIAILLSDFEGLPLSIIESMRAGLPIIASNVGGVNELVTSENGFLVGDDESISNKIEELILDKELRIAMGKKSRQLFEECFTFNQMFNQTISFYYKIVAKRGMS